MKIKNITIMALLLLIFITVMGGAVSATQDVASNDNLTASENEDLLKTSSDELIEKNNDNSDLTDNSMNEKSVLLVSEENVENNILTTNHTPQNFVELQDTVNNADDGDIIVLDGYYAFERNITVSKTLTFVGKNNAIVDGLTNANMFEITGNNVLFKYITFKNGYSDNYGGAINGRSDTVTINCTFINNTAHYGGAMSSSSAVNCTFTNNTASYSGGAMFMGGAVNCTFTNNTADIGGAIFRSGAVNCSFVNNSANSEGGAIYGLSYSSSYVALYARIECCTFVGNHAKYGGAAFGCDSVNCTFINNNASSQGGAIKFGGALNSTFKNNHANEGGAVFSASIYNCSFIENFGTQSGVAMREGSATNCIFTNHSDVVVFDSTVNNCTFINNSATCLRLSDAKNSKFINNSVGISGNNAVNCTFINNTIGMNGDAVNCTFISNNETALSGGSAINCTFIKNSGNTGGAIKNARRIVNCTFINNSAIYGGAISGSYLNGITNLLTLIENCTFINNSATYGGAIYNGNIHNSTFLNNTADYGGAIYTFMAGSIENCEFDKNNAIFDGGSVYLEKNCNITGCNFNNSYSNQGGAIYCNQTAGLNLTKSTFNNCSSNDDTYLKVDLQSDYSILDCIFDVAPAGVSFHYESTLTADNITFFNGEDAILEVYLSYIKGPLYNENIVFMLNNNELFANTTNSEGLTYINLKDYLNKSGSYDLTITYAGDDIINRALLNVSVLVNIHESILNVSDVELYKNEYGSLSAKLYNIRGPLSGKQVIFTLNGIDYKRTTDSEGNVEFNIFNYVTDLGKFDVEVNYGGDNYNSPVSKNVSAYIINYNGTLTCSVDGKYFNDTILTFSLSNNKNNKPIFDAPIEVVFSNGVIVGLNTDVNGIASYRMPFNPGTYDFSAKINQTYVNVNNVTLSDIEINKIFGVIEHSLANGNRTLKFKLYNTYNQDVFRNVKISLVFNNGEEAEIITDGDGIASYDIPFPKGTYSVSVMVKGDFKDFDDDYISNIVVSNVLNCSINFTNDIVFDYGGYGSTNFTIDGGIVESGNIYVADHPEAIISLNNNVITVFGLSSGTYTLFVKTTPDDYHNAVTGTVNITVNNVDSKVSFSADIVFDYGSSCSIYVSVEGGSILKENIAIVDHPDAAIDFTNDIITISGLDVGKYNLTVVTTPEKDYNAITAGVGFTIKEIDSDIIFSNPIEFTQGESGSTTITAIGCEENIGDISIVNNPGANIEFKNNIITVSGLNFGEYVLRIDTNPDKNHKSVSRTLNVTVLKMLSSITFDDKIVFDYGGMGSTKLNVNGGSVVSSDIRVINHTEAIISMNSNNDVSVSNLPAGNYTLLVVTTPDDTHRSVEATLPVEVNKVNSAVSFNDNVISYDYGDLGSTTVIVDGGSVSKVTISVIGHPYAKITLVGNQISISDLDAGNYTLQVSTIPDSNHVSVTDYLDVEVSKAKSTINHGHDITFDYGKVGSTTLILDGCSVELSNMEIVDHPDANLGIDTNNVVFVSGLDAGSYILSVTSTPDDNHESVTKLISVTVNKVNSTVDFSKKQLSFVYGGFDSINVNVTGGSLEKSGISILNHNESDIDLNNSIITVSNLNAGSYTLSVTSTPDNNHFAFTNYVDIIVKKADSTVTFENDLEFDYGGEASVTVNVTGGSLEKSGISVLNHKEANITLNNDMITVSNLNAGSYTLSVTSTPDDNHEAVTKTLGFRVNKVNSTIRFNGNQITFVYGSSGSIEVTVTGGSISISDVKVIGYDAKPTFKDNKITVSGLNVGNYTLKVTTTPDSNHFSVSDESIDIFVTKAQSKIIYTADIIFDYLSSGSTSLILDGCSVNINNISVIDQNASVFINKNNVITVSGLESGAYTLKVAGIPDPNHEYSEAYIPVVVNKIDSKVSFTDDIISFNYNTIGSTTIVSENCKIATVSVIGQDKIKPVLKDNMIKISGLAVGKYVLKVTTTPDDNYKAVDAFINVTVVKNPSKINVKKQTFAYKKGGKWTITLKDSNGAPISGIKVKLKVYTGKKTKTYNVKTNSKGIAYFKASTLAIGTHKVILSASHAGYTFKSVTSSVKVIKQTALTIKVNKKNLAYGASLSITVMNKKTKKPLNGIKVKLLIYTGSKLTKTVVLKTLKKFGNEGICGYATNELSASTHKVKIVPYDNVKYGGSAISSLKITKAHKKRPAATNKVSA